MKIASLLMGCGLWTCSLAGFAADNTTTSLLHAPDYDNRFLENLATPDIAREEQIVPTIIEGHEWRGTHCGIAQADQVIFRHADSWDLFWQKAMSPYSRHFRSIPTIDFTKDMVVAVFAGEMSHPGYEIQILTQKEVKLKTGRIVMVVNFKNIHRPVGVFKPHMAVQPFHLLKIPVYGGPVLFHEAKK